jgi:hypothetical protein
MNDFGRHRSLFYVRAPLISVVAHAQMRSVSIEESRDKREFPMSSPSGFPILHRGGDSFFDYLIRGTMFQIQVTHECLEDVFGSQGGSADDEAALLDNLQQIVDVVTRKVEAGARSPVQVLKIDF